MSTSTRRTTTPNAKEQAAGELAAQLFLRRLLAARELAAGQLPTSGALNDFVPVDWEVQSATLN